MAAEDLDQVLLRFGHLLVKVTVGELGDGRVVVEQRRDRRGNGTTVWRVAFDPGHGLSVAQRPGLAISRDDLRLSAVRHDQICRRILVQALLATRSESGPSHENEGGLASTCGLAPPRLATLERPRGSSRLPGRVDPLILPLPIGPAVPS